MQVLALVLRAPSGFNMQPYQCIVVTSDEAKQKLSKGMLGSNQQRSVAKKSSVLSDREGLTCRASLESFVESVRMFANTISTNSGYDSGTKFAHANK